MKRKTLAMATVLACSCGDAPARLTGHFIRLRCCMAAKVAWIRRGRMDVRQRVNAALKSVGFRYVLHVKRLGRFGCSVTVTGR